MQRKVVIGLAAALCLLAAIVAPAGAKPKKKFVPDLASYVGPTVVDGHTQTQAASVTIEGHHYWSSLKVNCLPPPPEVSKVFR